MKKLFTLVALAALAFTSCVKEDETYKEFVPLMPGMNIYNGSMTMQRVATQPMDMAVRFATLYSEAFKQNPNAVDPDLTKVMDGSVDVFKKLFGKQVTLTQNGTIYKLVFKTDEVTEYYMSQGAIEIETHGKRLEDTSVGEPWSVRLGSDYAVVVVNNNGYNTLLASAAPSRLYADAGMYKFEMQGFKAGVKNSAIQSNWNSSMSFAPSTGLSLAYTSIKDQTFRLSGSGEGPSCVTFDGKVGTKLSFRLSDAVAYSHLVMKTGDAVCKLTGENDYNASYYTSRVAEVEWSVTAEDKLVIMLTYNNIMKNVVGWIR